MKILLIPTLTLTLALGCPPAFAQEIAAPGAPPPATPAEARGGGGSYSRPEKPPAQIEEVDKARAKMVGELTRSALLPNPVHIDGTRLDALIDDLNARLAKSGQTPLNVVAEPELASYPVPAMTLQNVSATDVLNVVAKVTGLKLEPVPSDSGRVAAWIVTRRKGGGGPAGMMGGFFGGSGGGGATEVAPGSVAGEGAPELTPPPETSPSSAEPAAGPGAQGGDAQAGFLSRLPIMGKLFTPAAGSMAAGGAGGSATWEDTTPGAPPPMLVNRVLGIARIYEDIANKDERAAAEDQLARTLQKLAAEQKLECNVRLYGELHVIVVKGPAEAVALVEQTVTAMKENADAKKPSGGGNKFSSGIGTKQ